MVMSWCNVFLILRGNLCETVRTKGVFLVRPAANTVHDSQDLHYPVQCKSNTSRVFGPWPRWFPWFALVGPGRTGCIGFTGCIDFLGYISSIGFIGCIGFICRIGCIDFTSCICFIGPICLASIESFIVSILSCSVPLYVTSFMYEYFISYYTYTMHVHVYRHHITNIIFMLGAAHC